MYKLGCREEVKYERERRETLGGEGWGNNMCGNKGVNVHIGFAMKTTRGKQFINSSDCPNEFIISKYNGT